MISKIEIERRPELDREIQSELKILENIIRHLS